ncbi:RNA polymerase sigma factor [Aequorivita sp. Q41]|uniref:RNA polymerase sigma factor n=1 Tax=Aequorivita sp. Q41 TaxID=3153300 RepID=UPI003241C21E
MTNQKESILKDSVHQFGTKLFGFIRKRTRNEEDAEDILQDVWYQFSNFANVEDLENIGAWLYRVARNRVTDRYRKKTTDLLEDQTSTQNDVEEDSTFKELLLLDDSNSPDLRLFKENFWDALMEALTELPEKQRNTFIWNEIEDLTLQQIADKTGENLKTIISRKGYAVKHLRLKMNYLYQELNQ